MEKNNRLEEESFKCRRALEENASLQRKVEKLKRVEYLGYSDEILVEEVKMYKVWLPYVTFNKYSVFKMSKETCYLYFALMEFQRFITVKL